MESSVAAPLRVRDGGRFASGPLPSGLDRRIEKLTSGALRRMDRNAREVTHRMQKRLEAGEAARSAMRRAWDEMADFRRAELKKLGERIARMLAAAERRLAAAERRRRELVTKARSAGNVPERLGVHLDSANPAARAIAFQVVKERMAVSARPPRRARVVAWVAAHRATRADRTATARRAAGAPSRGSNCAAASDDDGGGGEPPEPRPPAGQPKLSGDEQEQHGNLSPSAAWLAVARIIMADLVGAVARRPGCCASSAGSPCT